MLSVSREFQVFVKPAGAECNLQCSYCYYLKNRSLKNGNAGAVMSDELLEKYVIQHISASTGNIIFFSWHGGEPLLAGIDFYRKAVRFQKQYQPEGSTIINGVQTNGSLVNDEWAGFFAEEKFVAGMSIDGPGELHNKFRRTKSNQPSLEKVLRGYQILRNYGINPEILCVVNSHNVKYPLVVYDFFRDLGAEYITFLPLVERVESNHSQVSERSVPSIDFGLFLSAIFDEWIEKDIGKIKIQIIEETTRTAFNLEHTLCIFRKSCGGVPVVEYNGDFYSCDHYVNREHWLGNIKDHPLEFYLDSPGQKRFGDAKASALPRYCLECEVIAMCNGECPKNRFITTPDGEAGLNYLCAGYKYFFNHCRPFVEAIRKTIGYQP